MYTSLESNSECPVKLGVLRETRRKGKEGDVGTSTPGSTVPVRPGCGVGLGVLEERRERRGRELLPRKVQW